MSWAPKRTRACFYHVIRSHLLFILHFGVSLKCEWALHFACEHMGWCRYSILNYLVYLTSTHEATLLNVFPWSSFFFVCPPQWELFRSPIAITKLILIETKERFCKKQNEKKKQNIKTFSVKTWSRDSRHLFSKNSNPLVMNGVD